MDLDEIKRGLRAEIKKMENEQYFTFHCNVREMCKDVLAKLEEQANVIAELNLRIYDGDKDFEIANNQIERLLKIVRHQKYKRCIAMAEQCKESLRLMRTYEVTDDYWNLEFGHDAEYFCKRGDFYKKWRKRWLELAEQFKEAKCR
ncbi:hypothetical protein BGX16_2378 [Hallerella succinigenes]|uniref:Uncharacterized protein n=2 Tax=Hallerella succinigenes TaxID=1896222 RepID=A0A2M9A9F6_9BACT|nr:hypothetical protein BGX16_2378 [Hallerella succinigenes]